MNKTDQEKIRLAKRAEFQRWLTAGLQVIIILLGIYFGVTKYD